MTCIVGVVDKANKTVYMGADSAGCANGTCSTILTPKVFVKDNILIGYTSSFRMGQLLQYDLKLPQSHADDTHEYMVRQFIPVIRKVLKEGGYAEKDKEQETGGTFLVGINGRLFTVQSDYSVLENIYPYDAVGSGADYAFGSLYTSFQGDLYYEEIVELALQSASMFSTTVIPPFHILSL